MPPKPLVLGFDTSVAHCAAALICGDRVLAEQTDLMARGQAEHLFPLLETLLTRAGKTWADLDGIGCGIGPGNFTGIRLSVSAARGLALSLGKPAIGISSFQALAFDLPGRVLVTLDARRDQLYAQLFDGDHAEEPALYDRQALHDAYCGKVETCVGHDAPAIAALVSARATVPTSAMATSIARLASQRLGQPAPRPAPMYLKPADAAPSADKAPVLLP